MGFLSMCGLMKVEDHNRIVAEHEALAARFSQLSMARCDVESELSATEAILITRENELADMTAKFKKAVTDLERVVGRNQELMFEKGQLAAANSSLRSEIAALTPDAEATRKRRVNDAKRVRPSRAKKGAAAVKAAPKAKAASVKAPR